jgi:hypothetical protein
MPKPNPLLADDPATIADLDALLTQQRSDICHIQAPSYAIDAGGAPLATTYITVATVACKVREGGLGAAESVAGGVFRAVADYSIHFHRDVMVESDYRVRKEGADGAVMEVTGDSRLSSHGLELIVSTRVVS